MGTLSCNQLNNELSESAFWAKILPVSMLSTYLIEQFQSCNLA